MDANMHRKGHDRHKAARAHAGKARAGGCCRRLGRERVTDVRHQFPGRLLSAAPAGISRHTPAPDKQLPQNDLNHTHTHTEQARTTYIIHTHTQGPVHPYTPTRHTLKY